MTISFSSVLNKIGPKPKTIYQAIADGKVKPDINETVKDARKSAAFFNAQGMMKKGVEDQAKKGKFSSIFASLKNSKAGKNTSKVCKSVSDKTITLVSKSSVKKACKYGAIGVAVLGGLALVGYLGKKVYNAYQNRIQKPNAKPNVDSKSTSAPVAASNVHSVEKGDNVWNIAKKDLESKGGKVTNAEIAKRTAEIMELNNLKYANDKGLVIIRPGEQIKLSA